MVSLVDDVCDIPKVDYLYGRNRNHADHAPARFCGKPRFPRRGQHIQYRHRYYLKSWTLSIVVDIIYAPCRMHETTFYKALTQLTCVCLMFQVHHDFGGPAHLS